jgi:hypothetical protein
MVGTMVNNELKEFERKESWPKCGPIPASVKKA